MTDQYKHTDLISCAVWSTLEAVALNFWPEFVGWKRVSRRHHFDFIPDWAMPVSVPQSLLWSLTVLVRCYGYWGCPCARLVAGLVALVLPECIKKDFMKEAATIFYLKPQGLWWTITSLEALGFPLQCTKSLVEVSLSGSVFWHLLTLTTYVAVGKKVEITVMRTDIRSCFEDTPSKRIWDGRMPALPQLPKQKYLHPISSTTPCFKG